MRLFQSAWVPGRAERLPSMSFHLARWHPRRGAAQTSILNHPSSLLADSYPRADWPESGALLPRSHFQAPLSSGCTGPRLARLASEAYDCRVRGCSLQDGSSRGWRLEPEKASIYKAFPAPSPPPWRRGPGHWLPCQYGRPSGPAPAKPRGPRLPRPRLCRPGRIGC